MMNGLMITLSLSQFASIEMNTSKSRFEFKIQLLLIEPFNIPSKIQIQTAVKQIQIAVKQETNPSAKMFNNRPQQMFQNANGLDELIQNEGYMSERTKSPRRVQPIQPYQNTYELYPQNHPGFSNPPKVNTLRDMSPNKINPKGKPMKDNANNLLMQMGANRAPLGGVNSNQMNRNNFQLQQQQQLPFVQSQKLGGRNIPRNASQQQLTAQNFDNTLSPRAYQNQSCIYHPHKKSEFLVDKNGQLLTCCKVCAAKEAANNFQVIEISSIRSKSKPHQPDHSDTQQKPSRKFTTRPIPEIAKYKGNPVYEEIIQFLKEVRTVEAYHFENYRQLENIDSHYDSQISMVNEFYLHLEDILEQMHRDHIADLEAEKTKNSQIADIYMNEINENLSTVDQIVEDLYENFEYIVDKLTPGETEQFNETLDRNRSNIKFFTDQVEQQREMLVGVTNYQEGNLAAMVKQYEKDLMALWERAEQLEGQRQPDEKGVASESQNQQPQYYSNPSQPSKPNQEKIKVREIHRKGSEKECLNRDFDGKGACRQIFLDDEEENLVEKVSPKFKNI